MRMVSYRGEGGDPSRGGGIHTSSAGLCSDRRRCSGKERFCEQKRDGKASGSGSSEKVEVEIATDRPVAHLPGI